MLKFQYAGGEEKCIIALFLCGLEAEKQHLVNLAVVKLPGWRMEESSLALELHWETVSKLYLKLQLQGRMMRIPSVLLRERPLKGGWEEVLYKLWVSRQQFMLVTDVCVLQGVVPTAQRAAIVVGVELPVYDITKKHLILSGLMGDTIFTHFV